MSDILQQIAQQGGIIGLVLVLVLLALIYVDKRSEKRSAQAMRACEGREAKLAERLTQVEDRQHQTLANLALQSLHCQEKTAEALSDLAEAVRAGSGAHRTQKG